MSSLHQSSVDRVAALRSAIAVGYGVSPDPPQCAQDVLMALEADGWHLRRDSFVELVDTARRMLDTDYPADIFVGGENTDPGAAFVVKLREALALVAPIEEADDLEADDLAGGGVASEPRLEPSGCAKGSLDFRPRPRQPREAARRWPL